MTAERDHDPAAQPLRGLRVLNPRPAAQAHGLNQALLAAGADVLALPLLDILPLPITAQGRTCLLALDRYDATLFVSANAARLGLEAVAECWPQWPFQLPAFAVGAATHELLADAGLSVTCPQQEDSEGLLALTPLQQVSGQRWLLFSGAAGRPLLLDSLRARGAQVDVLTLYERTLPTQASAQWQALSAQAMPDVVLLSSALVWQHWQQVAGTQALLPTLVCVSERLAEQVRLAGAERVICANGASSQAWLAVLCHWRQSSTHGIQ